MSTPDPNRKRKAAPRSADVVIACIEERLLMGGVGDGANVTRIEELLDELKRSLKKGTTEEGAQ